MHSVQLARLAALVAIEAPLLIRQGRRIDSTAMTAYWVASRQRLDLWHRGLARLGELEAAGRSLAIRQWWQQHHHLIEEVLVSEILTRVMAALGAVIDASVSQREIEPVTQSVFLGHLEARNRVLRMLLFGRGGTVDEAMRLNRLRRAVERWVDFLLGPFGRRHPEAMRFTIDAGRARSLGTDATPSIGGLDQIAPTLSWLTLSTIELSLLRLCQSAAALPHANRQLAESVLGCLPPELFDSFGFPLSKATVQILHGQSAEGCPAGQPLADQLIFHGGDTRPSAPHLARWVF